MAYCRMSVGGSTMPRKHILLGLPPSQKASTLSKSQASSWTPGTGVKPLLGMCVPRVHVLGFWPRMLYLSDLASSSCIC